MIDDDAGEETPRAESESAGAYAVGYGKPPVHSRFKPGQSGNPKGRRMVRPSLKMVVEAAFYEKVSVQTPRGVRKISKIDALVRRLLNDALKGDGKSIQQVVRLAKDAGLNQEAEVVETALDQLCLEDQRIYDRICRAVAGDDGAEPNEAI